MCNRLPLFKPWTAIGVAQYECTSEMCKCSTARGYLENHFNEGMKRWGEHWRTFATGIL